MFKSKAGNLRTSRRQAEKIGTNPAGFEGGLDIDPNAGVPKSAVTGDYKGNAPLSSTHGTGSAPSKPAPFKVGQ